jgi:hypothetical protein
VILEVRKETLYIMGVLKQQQRHFTDNSKSINVDSILKTNCQAEAVAQYSLSARPKVSSPAPPEKEKTVKACSRS